MNNRLIKILIGASTGLYLILVCVNNITDYGTNFQFVSKVTGMEDVFSVDRTGWRSIHNECMHHLLYGFIIIWEFITAGLILTGTYRMIRKLKSDANEFTQSKQLLVSGLMLGILLWFGVFITIGGEWFLMWQSKTWNGENTAYLLTITFTLFLLYISQKDE